MLKKICVCMGTLTIVGLLTMVAAAQSSNDNMGQQGSTAQQGSMAPQGTMGQQDTMGKQDSMGKEDNMGKKMSVTGCLMKGTSADGYYLKGENGNTYELWGSKTLGEHVNHQVTVSGMEKEMPASMEKKHEMNETKEAGTGQHMDLKVSHIKMVSDTCK